MLSIPHNMLFHNPNMVSKVKRLILSSHYNTLAGKNNRQFIFRKSDFSSSNFVLNLSIKKSLN